MGRPTIARLIGAGHIVIGMAARRASVDALESLGAKAAFADARDERAVARALADARPDVVVHQLTSLPSHYTAEEMQASAERDRRVRLDGGANLVKAARAVGARRFVVSSGAYFAAPGEGLANEEAPFAIDAARAIAAGARLIQDLERLVLDVPQLEGIALRYGFFYGPRTWYWPDGDMAAQVRARQYPILGEGRGVWSFVHVEDAAAATALVVDCKQPSRVYNVTDDEPSELRSWLPAFAQWVGAPEPPRVALSYEVDASAAYYANGLRGASNAKARRELGFRPRRAPWFETST